MSTQFPIQMLLPIVLMLLFGAYTVYTMKKRRASMGPAARMFFERTGYRYADIPNASLDEQAAYGEKLVSNAGRKGYEIHWVRDFHGVPIHWRQAYKMNDQGGWAISAAWSVPLAKTPRVLVQIAEKSLRGIGKAVKEVFSNMERKWEPIYPKEVTSGDAELDARLVFLGEDEGEVRRVLSAPGLKELLLGCVEVDVTVHRDEVRFADPLQKNVRAGMGGMVGMMAMGSDMGRMMELSIPVHDRMAELLATLARACA